MMIKLDPILAVKDVEASADWYQKIFGFVRQHGGQHFAVLASSSGEIVLCLHQWGTHEHPTMVNQAITPGNGLLLYFRTENMRTIYGNTLQAGCTIEEDIHLNPNSLRDEFSFRDPNGYFLTVTENHSYEG